MKGQPLEEQGEAQDQLETNLSQQIRLLREHRNLSQRALAEASGISRNTLSLLERGLTSPTVSTLVNIADALGVDINAFFQPVNETRVVFTKAEQRPHLQLSQGVLSDLGLGIIEQSVTPLTLRLEPGARSGPSLTHDGQDFIYCLRGELLYKVNGLAYLMEPGDSLLFDGRLPHRFHNTGLDTTEILIILSTPHDGSEYIAGHFPKEDLT